jgi:hypothetical protein
MRKSVWKRAGAVISCIFVLGGFSPQQAAAEAIDTEKDVAMTIHCMYQGEPVEDVLFDIYCVGEISSSGEFVISEDFAQYAVNSFDLKNSDWRMLAETLDGYAQRDHQLILMEGRTNEEGILKLPKEGTLNPGVYLCEAHQKIEDDGGVYTIDPLLVSLPEVEEDGTTVYDADIYPKINYTDLEEGKDFTVIKVWKDSETASGTTGSTAEDTEEKDGQDTDTGRPSQIEVQLLKDGEIYDTVKLNAANNWRYTWTELDETAEWTAVEKKVPDGYTVETTLEDNNSRLVITNTENPEPTEEPQPSQTPKPGEPSQTPQPSGKPSQDTTSSGGKLPQTGMLWWPIPGLSLAGLVLFVIGWLKHKNRL